MTDFVIAALLLTGGFFALVAALGILRFPDVFMRLHAAAKAGTLGAGCLLASVAVYFQTTSITARAVAAVVFLLLTAPVASHVIGRAAYRSGTRLWRGTRLNELEED
jgi:multicomponent Na+:H+ antiporter subunit G